MWQMKHVSWLWASVFLAQRPNQMEQYYDLAAGVLNTTLFMMTVIQRAPGAVS